MRHQLTILILLIAGKALANNVAGMCGFGAGAMLLPEPPALGPTYYNHQALPGWSNSIVYWTFDMDDEIVDYSAQGWATGGRKVGTQTATWLWDGDEGGCYNNASGLVTMAAQGLGVVLNLQNTATVWAAWIQIVSTNGTDFARPIIDWRHTEGHSSRLSARGDVNLHAMRGYVDHLNAGPYTNLFQTGVWYRVAYVCCGTSTGDVTRHVMYVNGEVVATNNATANTSYAFMYPYLTVGGDKDFCYAGWRGKIDDVAILYNRWWTTNEAMQDYLNGRTTNSRPWTWTAKDDLASLHTFNKATGTRAVNRVNTTNSIYGAGSTMPTWAMVTTNSFLEYHAGIDLDGVDDYMTNCWSMNLPAGTVVAWVYPDDAAPAKTNAIVSMGTNAWSLCQAVDRWRFCGPWNGDYLDTPDALVQTTSVDLAVTWTGTMATIYIDGVAVTSGAITAVGTPATSMKLGRAESSGGYFNGKLMELCVWDRPLTAGEILANHTNRNTKYGAGY